MENQPQLPLPEPYTFTRPLLDAWFSVQPDEYVEVKLTRRDFDAIFNAFKTSLEAQDGLDQAVVLLSQGKVDEANAWMEASRRHRVESFNAFKRFFSAVMDAATRQDANV